MAGQFGWKQLEKLEASIAWRRELDNAPLAHVWHLETLADLAKAFRRLLEKSELDERLLAELWRRVPEAEREELAREIEARGGRFSGTVDRLTDISR